MLLYEKLENSGQFLFRWRGYLPLIFLAAAVATLYANHSNAINWIDWSFVCFGVGLIGIVIRIMTVSFVPHGTTGRGTDTPYAERLNTTGMYSIMRNPVYFGNFFTFLAPVMYAQSYWLVALYLPVFALYHERIITAEERFLVGKFGDQYRQWAHRTPTFFPKLANWVSPDLPFSWKMAYKRESISLFTLAITLAALQLMANYLSYNQLFLDQAWWVILIVSAVIYISNCLLVQFTKFLDL